MIRRAVPEDAGAILSIWRICFGDEESYIRFFLQHRFPRGRCLVFEADGAPAAMLHLLDASYWESGLSEPACTAQYVYAAATLPQYRGRGVMARLLAAAEREGEKRGFRFTFLLPGSESLYGYYARLGYRAAFSIRKLSVQRPQLTALAAAVPAVPAAAAPDAVPTAGETDLNQVFRIRSERFRPGLLWNAPELRYALAEWCFTGGIVLHLGADYALCREKGGVVTVKETTAPLSAAAAALLAYFPAERFEFLLPPRAEAPFPSRLERYGMLKPGKAGELFADSLANARPYVNLLLD